MTGRATEPGSSVAGAVHMGRPGVPRLALSGQEACEALGCGWDFWRQHVEPELRLVRRGRRKLVSVAELQDWLDRSGEHVL